MTDQERKTINIPEICRVEGHAAVHVDIAGGVVQSVTLDVFEGTRFFEKIVVGRHFDQMPHITSRVCAICSTGHVLAASAAVEEILGYRANRLTRLLRELMHLGMVIESHATHIYALAMPDYLGVDDLLAFASERPDEFQTWTRLRSLGSDIQTTVGGRPFHPVNLHVGGLSRVPAEGELASLKQKLGDCIDLAVRTCEILSAFKPPVARTTQPVFLALVPDEEGYGYFGDTVLSSEGWSEPVQAYRQYLEEKPVAYSHAKQSTARGKPLMVGSMARLSLFAGRLLASARSIFASSPLAHGDTNSLWNNLAQAIEVVEAMERAGVVIDLILERYRAGDRQSLVTLSPKAGTGVGAVECPRGTLYHSYTLDESGRISQADMVTPSAQNTRRIELDIREVVDKAGGQPAGKLESDLETLVRAYDPCNTCATHMVSVRWT